ncbi:head GIN domain-containing protein [Flavobacterium inviolabile]|uniref:head GIN domain-containing protein n=1 Tax=Flavobacterium inviolabile TaxID=2748320 RepID=UPI0015B2A0FE|nr:head GIN domain-containing protein [Flavobacterium inviolabile]
MMKVTKKHTVIYLLLLAFMGLSSCDSGNAPDCLMSVGTIVSNEIAVADFDKINIAEGIELIVKQGAETKVVLETGTNLVPGISISVADGELFLRNSNGCNWLREYNTTRVYVTVPDLKNIYSASQFNVKSDGVLHFPDFKLQSGMFADTASGIFELEVNCTNLVVEDNRASLYRISGYTENLNIAFYSGEERFEGQNLSVQNVYVFQRSTNDIIVKPLHEIKGNIYSTGNVVLKSTPSTVEVTQHYTGHLIYN